MKERPILFSTPMVQAILEGRKTQTRRIIKFCKKVDADFLNEIIFRNFQFYRDQSYRAIFDTDEHPFSEKFPYGKKGDILWVRETWCPGLCIKDPYAYKATFKKSDLEEGFNEKIKWKPSIFMPREACRIRLEITNIRVERLKDISDQDAIDEGIEFRKDIEMWRSYYLNDTWYGNPIWSYRSLWEKINGKDSWNSNPWVFVIEFKRI